MYDHKFESFEEMLERDSQAPCYHPSLLSSNETLLPFLENVESF